MFGKKTVRTHYDYDKETQKPILKCSICNGEQIAGFKNLRTGKFDEIMMIRSEGDLREFMERCGVSEISKEY